MELTNTNTAKSNTSLGLNASSIFVAILLAGVVFSNSQTATAQERLAMLTRANARPVYHAEVDSNTNTPKATATTTAASEPSFDIMGTSSPLNESLVMDFSAKKRMDGEASHSLTSEEAHPKAGWNAFEKYISALAISPDAKTGKVQLTFTVNPNGSVCDFKIAKGLTDVANQKAIELVKDGPNWAGNDQPKQVTVTVKFHSQNTDQAVFL